MNIARVVAAAALLDSLERVIFPPARRAPGGGFEPLAAVANRRGPALSSGQSGPHARRMSA